MRNVRVYICDRPFARTFSSSVKGTDSSDGLFERVKKTVQAKNTKNFFGLTDELLWVIADFGLKSEILYLHMRNLSLSTANNLNSIVVAVVYWYDDMVSHNELFLKIVIFKKRFLISWSASKWLKKMYICSEVSDCNIWCQKVSKNPI